MPFMPLFPLGAFLPIFYYPLGEQVVNPHIKRQKFYTKICPPGKPESYMKDDDEGQNPVINAHAHWWRKEILGNCWLKKPQNTKFGM